MPVFNSKKYIKKALNNILKQNYKNFILLISDNNSSDKSYEICKQFSIQDERIQLFKQSKNIGATKNIKYLLEKVKTEFVMVASSDDYLSIDWVDKLMSIQNKKKCLAFGDTIYINSYGQKVIHQSSLANQSLKGKSIIKRSAFFFKSGLEGKMITFWGIYPTKIMKNICLNNKDGLMNENKTYALDTRIVFKAIKYLDIYQDKSTFLFKRLHSESDSLNPENINKNDKRFRNRYLNLFKTLFRIHTRDALWQDLSNLEKWIIIPLGFFIYPQSFIISLVRMAKYFSKKYLGKTK